MGLHVSKKKENNEELKLLFVPNLEVDFDFSILLTTSQVKGCMNPGSYYI